MNTKTTVINQEQLEAQFAFCDFAFTVKVVVVERETGFQF